MDAPPLLSRLSRCCQQVTGGSRRRRQWLAGSRRLPASPRLLEAVIIIVHTLVVHKRRKARAVSCSWCGCPPRLNCKHGPSPRAAPSPLCTSPGCCGIANGGPSSPSYPRAHSPPSPTPPLVWAPSQAPQQCRYAPTRRARPAPGRGRPGGARQPLRHSPAAAEALCGPPPAPAVQGAGRSSGGFGRWACRVPASEPWRRRAATAAVARSVSSSRVVGPASACAPDAKPDPLSFLLPCRRPPLPCHPRRRRRRPLMPASCGPTGSLAPARRRWPPWQP